MDLTLFQQKDIFPRFVMDKLAAALIDYKEINLQIDKSRQEGSHHLKAAVVLLLNFKEINGHSEFVFQLIKRSEKVSQAGDISCPGGMLQPKRDNFLNFVLKTGILPAIRGRKASRTQKVDRTTAALINLFLTTALREAWEEIGLNPLNTRFIGALPSYSLTMFARTIFPVVCVTRKTFKYKLSSEVEKIVEIPLSYFFQSDNYGMLDIKTSLGKDTEPLQYQMPCLVIPDGSENYDILWGATFNIIHNFLRIVSDGSLPADYSSRTLNKVLTLKYISPRG
jgi:8-oxo-dGTP pyrophosphatase MutT (NUDIX family)